MKFRFKQLLISSTTLLLMQCVVVRGTALPVYVYKVAKSWKHNSRRRHQYHKQDIKKGLIVL
ncbi:hypothetical protein GCM10007354_10750 [Acinetobacter courvalinii]|uniref:Uncharacterized protein n=1 Tax=Acinetobacter courvalinii TaxID=280147 RepID=A0ABD0A5A4_9GAMM|nr:hypothetical protein GCM10007354_10750 [Acinetobacter courvalinii]